MHPFKGGFGLTLQAMRRWGGGRVPAGVAAARREGAPYQAAAPKGDGDEREAGDLDARLWRGGLLGRVGARRVVDIEVRGIDLSRPSGTPPKRPIQAVSS
jgi:hypothetical protein